MSFEAPPLKAAIAQPPTAIAPRSALTLVIISAVLWFLAVLFIRYIGPLGAFRGLWAPVTYAATFPLTWPIVRPALRRAGLGSEHTLVGVAIMSMTALFLDGTALAWLRGLYGTDQAVILGGAAWLLWAVGVAFAIALWMSRPARS